MLHGAHSTIYIDDLLFLSDLFDLGVLQDKFIQEYDICPSPSITKFEFSIASDVGSKGYFVYIV